MSKSYFLSGPKPKVKRVEIDGQVLHIRALSCGDQMGFQGADAKPSEFVGRLLVLSIVDEDGSRTLSDEDVPAVLELDAQYLGKVVEEITKLNEFTSAEVDVLAGK